MKKVLPVLVLTSFLAVLVVPAMASAAIPTATVVGSITGILNVVNKLINYFFVFVIAVAVFFLLMAAFNFMTAAGDQTKITKARGELTNALIGIGIAVAVKGIMLLIGGLLGVDLGPFLSF